MDRYNKILTESELKVDVEKKDKLRAQGIDVRTSNTLSRARILDPEHIASLSDDELRSIRGIGDVGIAQIRNAHLNAPDLDAYLNDQTWFPNTSEIFERF